MVTDLTFYTPINDCDLISPGFQINALAHIPTVNGKDEVRLMNKIDFAKCLPMQYLTNSTSGHLLRGNLS